MDVCEIAVASARQAYHILRKSIAVSDAGLYIEGLNNFPGPFLKYMNHWFRPEDVLCLLCNCENRKAVVRECLVIVDEDGNITTREADFKGKIAKKPSEGIGTTMERIFVPTGMKKTAAEMTQEEQIMYWQTDCTWSKWFASLS